MPGVATAAKRFDASGERRVGRAAMNFADADLNFVGSQFWIQRLA